MSSELDKSHIVRVIVEKLHANLALLMNAAKSAHNVATHEENIADNKYDTLSLEASYLAQGQANRAQEVRLAIDAYQHLSLQQFDADSAIGVSALAILEAEDGSHMTVFLGPHAGGLKVEAHGREVVVITPSSPLGKELLGKVLGDMVDLRVDETKRELEIIEVY
ncbi:GreA/GreB family elongation factor [Candidatus Entotheonella palauensis]|nr:GreA/GreB family elongation factor [Candidatus Entotheonella palauensis]